MDRRIHYDLSSYTILEGYMFWKFYRDRFLESKLLFLNSSRVLQVLLCFGDISRIVGICQSLNFVSLQTWLNIHDKKNISDSVPILSLKIFVTNLWKLRSWYIREFIISMNHSQPAFTCSPLTIETLEQDVKYVKS